MELITAECQNTRDDGRTVCVVVSSERVSQRILRDAELDFEHARKFSWAYQGAIPMFAMANLRTMIVLAKQAGLSDDDECLSKAMDLNNKSHDIFNWPGWTMELQRTCHRLGKRLITIEKRDR